MGTSLNKRKDLTVYKKKKEVRVKTISKIVKLKEM